MCLLPVVVDGCHGKNQGNEGAFASRRDAGRSGDNDMDRWPEQVSGMKMIT